MSKEAKQQFLNYSTSVSRTRKESPKDSFSVNHELLMKAGFIRQEAAGIYTILPLGARVMTNIEGIVREGMESLGAQELMMPALQPKALWDQTGRWDSVDVLFKVTSRIGDKQYALAATAEEIATPVARDRIHSFRDLPFSFYQIGRKYRDEARAKSGLIRGREFNMKDMYSFHADEEDFREFYFNTLNVYLEIFAECGIDAKVTDASGGDFTTLPTHEFMAISDAGEDEIIYCKDCTFAQNTEISHFHVGDVCPRCQGALSKDKSVEVGHIFDLGTKFSDRFDLTYTDHDGQKKPVLMGCYGIGTSRLLGTIVELHHDERGIIWPEAVSPYDVHIVGLNLENDKVRELSKSVIKQLSKQKRSVLFDDREGIRAGEKFIDADLIGIPTRIVISNRTINLKMLELSNRATGQSLQVSIDDFLNES